MGFPPFHLKSILTLHGLVNRFYLRKMWGFFLIILLLKMMYFEINEFLLKKNENPVFPGIGFRRCRWFEELI